MSIAAIAQRDVVTIDEHASAQEAAQLMRDRHIGALVVTRGDAGATRLVGLITDRDLALQVVAEGLAPQAPVGPMCGDEIAAAPHTASTDEAVEAMREAGVRRLLLVDGENQLAGIVTLDDLLAFYADQLGNLADALERGRDQEAGLDLEIGNEPVAVPEALAAAWRRTVQP